MALRRFYLESKAVNENQVVVQGELLHHMREVCRFATGDRFEALMGDGLAYLVEVHSLGKREMLGNILSARQLAPLSRPHITLALSVPKLPKVDWIVEKCVELGVSSIRPFVSEYSFLRKVSEISEARQQRWGKIVQSATQQSGRGDLLTIAKPTTLKTLLEQFNQSTATGGLFPYEGEAEIGLRQALAGLSAKNLDQLWVFVGSEGGFSTAEVQLFAAAGLNPVTLGEQILRVETACVALISVIKYETNK